MPTACRAPSRRCLAPQDAQHRLRLCRDVARPAAVESAGNAKFGPSSLIIPNQCEAASAIRVAVLRRPRGGLPLGTTGHGSSSRRCSPRGWWQPAIMSRCFATADSITAASLHATAPWGWSEDATIDAKVAECLHVASVFERADKFDIINNGFDFLPLTYIDLVPTPRNHHNPRLVVRADHSRLQALRQHHRVCVDKRLRSTPRFTLCRHDPPRHRPRRLRNRSQSGRGSAVFRTGEPPKRW
jgi:hypothetical protein